MARRGGAWFIGLSAATLILADLLGGNPGLGKYLEGT